VNHPSRHHAVHQPTITKTSPPGEAAGHKQDSGPEARARSGNQRLWRRCGRRRRIPGPSRGSRLPRSMAGVVCAAAVIDSG
jgi:hypothetical protein